MTVSDMIEKLGLEALNLSDGEKIIKGGYTGDLLSWVMGNGAGGCAWITIMSNANIIAVAALIDFSCVILAENVEANPALVKLAAEKGINLLRSDKNAFDTGAALSRFLL